MQDGDSFIVVPSSAPTSTSAPASSSTDLPAAIDQANSHEQVDQAGEIESSVPSPSIADSEEHVRSTIIHRLGLVQSSGHVRLDAIIHSLPDAACIVGVPYAQFVTFHRLHCKPNDQSVATDAIILLHVNDFPPNSTEQLVLVDVEMHVPTNSDSFPRAPLVTRQVHRIFPTIVRQQLLYLTRTAAYCEWHPLNCFAFHSKHLWSIQGRGPFAVTHGMYIRVVVLPPPNRWWDISRAISIFHDAAELFDPAEVGRVAEEFLNNRDVPAHGTRLPSETQMSHTDFIEVDQIKGADLVGDIDVAIYFRTHEHQSGTACSASS